MTELHAPTMQPFYFTFGLSHPLAHRFVVIDAVDWEAARAKMFQCFGREWGFQYDEEGWMRDGLSQAEQYNLTEVGIYGDPPRETSAAQQQREGGQ